jgi:hypothetical protein
MGGPERCVYSLPQLDEQDTTMDRIQRRVWRPLDEQDWLREELPALRGVPPELDRELLRRTKTAIHRSLSEHEKRLLREQARRIALGDVSSEVTLDAME